MLDGGSSGGAGVAEAGAGASPIHWTTAASIVATRNSALFPPRPMVAEHTTGAAYSARHDGHAVHGGARCSVAGRARRGAVGRRRRAARPRAAVPGLAPAPAARAGRAGR